MLVMLRAALLVAGCLLASPWSVAHDSAVTVTVKVTVVELPCTSTRNRGLRACARFQESTSIASFKSVERLAPEHGSTPIEAYRIRVHPERHVQVRTLLF